MRLLFITLVLYSQMAYGQTSYIIVGTKDVLTIDASSNMICYRNGDPTRNTTLEDASDMMSATSVYYEIIGGRRTAKISIVPVDSAASVSTMGYYAGTYQRLSDKKTFNLLSNSVYSLAGRWNVKMAITESTCTESPTGQQRTEIWHIRISQDGEPRVNVSDNAGTTIANYTADFDGAFLRMKATVDGLFSVKAKAAVTLLLQNIDTLNGSRQVNRNDPCSIRSTVTATRL